MTEHHASFCRCASCEMKQKYEAGEYTTKRAFENDFRELGVEI